MKTCRNCGTLFETRDCKVCARASAAKWRDANRRKRPSAENERNRSARRYAENPEKFKGYTAKYRSTHPNVNRICCHNRRSKKFGNGGVLSKGLSEKLLKLQKGKCACGCKQSLGDDYHLDHIMPIALGGENEDWNIQLLRQVCNNQKHAKHPIEFMQIRGFLI
jgi:5-methylcytosine-specific restriction endonuclease McrA